ncbi:MAG: tRNA lysidine(34) synthetase TilS [Candidatus Azosocius agrarius]|nr:MAG: tRNA lysidine(34) synthetase TilS [Gammaproteobacteria bacterium]
MKKSIKNLIFVGYSGGLDSTVLLYLTNIIFKKNIYILFAIHINHNININNMLWEKHCIQSCKEKKITILIFRIKLNKNFNLEKKSRNLRFEIYNKIIPNYSSLLLAHHNDDQSETIFFKLIKGINYLSKIYGMKKKIKFKKMYILKPLLNIKKFFIKLYAYKKNLLWINDNSNNNNYYDRNFIRNLIIPIIKTRWVFINKSINEIKNHFINNNLFFINLIKKHYIKALIKKHNIISIKYLLNLSIFFRVEIIKYWIFKNKITLKSNKYLITINNTFINSKINFHIIPLISQYKILKYFNKLHIIK